MTFDGINKSWEIIVNDGVIDGIWEGLKILLCYIKVIFVLKNSQHLCQQVLLSCLC